MITLLLLSLFIFPLIAISPSAITLFSLILTSIFTSLILYSPLLSPNTVSFPLIADSLSSPLILLSIWLSALIILSSQPYSAPRPKIFTIVILFLILTLILAFSSHSLLPFYMFFELSLPPTLLLILLWGYQPERLQAGIYIILYTITASLPLLLAILLLKASTGQRFIYSEHLFLPFSLPTTVV